MINGLSGLSEELKEDLLHPCKGDFPDRYQYKTEDDRRFNMMVHMFNHGVAWDIRKMSDESGSW